MRLRGAEKFGTKAEVKNLNSFRFLKQALDYEIARQVALLESGGRVMQETRLYQPRHWARPSACAARKHAHDYRYFPEPDLVPLRVSEAWLAGHPRGDAGVAGAQAGALHRGVTGCASTTPRC